MIKKCDKEKIYSLYESMIYIAKATDLSQDTGSSNDTPVIKEPEQDSQEIHMAKSALLQMSKDIQDLNEILNNEQGLEGWVAAKITIAADYISSTANWLRYKDEQPECGCEHDNI